MALITRSFTYRARIKVSAGDLELARKGQKTCTIRLGKLGVADETVNLTDGRESLRVKIVSVEADKFFKDLNDEHAHREGFACLGELRDDLKKYYGEIEALQPITIINFRCI